MSDQLNKEILEELKKINNKLDSLNNTKGLSTPIKIIAVILGFMVIGPLIAFLFSLLVFHS
ncbi:hypothetical protein M3231_02835 [Neobacillus mesonae]|nr:hypothetical protein [Neobacillus mesonae]